MRISTSQEHRTLFEIVTLYSGVTTDLIIYSIVIPVFPFQLEKDGHSGVSALVGYLLFAYVCV